MTALVALPTLSDAGCPQALCGGLLIQFIAGYDSFKTTLEVGLRAAAPSTVGLRPAPPCRSITLVHVVALALPAAAWRPVCPVCWGAH